MYIRKLNLRSSMRILLTLVKDGKKLEIYGYYIILLINYKFGLFIKIYKVAML